MEGVAIEYAFLGAVLNNPDALQRLPVLPAEEDFQHPMCRLLWRIFLRFKDNKWRIDPLLVERELLRDPAFAEFEINIPEYLTSMVVSCPEGGDPDTYAKMVRDRGGRIRLEAYAGTVSVLAQGAESLDSAVAQIQRFTDTLLSPSTEGGLRPIGELITERQDERLAAEDDDERPELVTSPIDDLNFSIGNFRPGQLIVLAGRPGMGKSALAMQLAYEAGVRQKHTVAVFSLEMSKEELVDRILCTEGQVDSGRYRQNQGLIYKEEWDRMYAVIQEALPSKLYVDDTRTLTPGMMRQRIDELTEKVGKPALVVVDYLQILTPSKHNPNRATEVGWIAEDLKTIAREVGCTVIALCQLSRAVESRPNSRPVLSDLRESGGVEAAADAVLMLYREEYYKPKEGSDGLVEEAEILITKQRSGPTGTVKVQFEPAYTRFSQLPDKPGVSGYEMEGTDDE